MKKLFYGVVFSFFLMTTVAGIQFSQSLYWEAKYLELRDKADNVDLTCDVISCGRKTYQYDIETLRETCRKH